MSLRDQLLQAGLISEKQAKQAAKQQHQHKAQQKQAQGSGRPPLVDERKRAAEDAAAAKRARDQELNLQAQHKAEQKARRAQVKQLVEQHRLPKPDAEELYNFVDGKRIRRLPVTPELRARLISGELAIVRCEGRYEIVPSAIGARIAERDPYALVARASTSEAVDENDPYKDYKVPDDLMW